MFGNIGKSFSQFWDSVLKARAIIFKNVYERIVIQNIHQQYSRFINDLSEFNSKQTQELKEYLVKQINQQSSQHIKQNKIEKLEYIKQSHQQNLAYLTQNKQQFVEFVDKTVGENKEEIKISIKKISDIHKQNKELYDNLITQNKKQIAEMLTQNKKQNSEHLKDFFDKSNKHMTIFIERFSKHATRENTRLLQQISKQTDQQISKFIKEISEKSNKQNLMFIKQNASLIKQMLQQSVDNHGTINEKMQKLVMYQPLLRLRENLVTIKISVAIIEKLDASQLKTVKNLYSEYTRLYPKVPFLDVTRGMIISKMLFPSFFTEILKNISSLKSQFDGDVYIEMTQTIHACALFFRNFKTDNLGEINGMLGSDMVILDEMLAKMID